MLWQKWHENERRQKQKIMELAQKGQSTTNLYSANTREVGPRLRGFRGCGMVVGGKGGYIWFLVVTFFGNIPY